MKITRVKDAAKKEAEVLIHSRPDDPEALQAEALLARAFSGLDQLYPSSIPAVLTAQKDGEIHKVPIDAICYAESIERRLIIYTKDDSYEVTGTLADMAEQFQGQGFQRISKSTLLNLKWLKSVKAQSGGRYEAALLNGERLLINRSYVPAFKRCFGI